MSMSKSRGRTNDEVVSLDYVLRPQAMGPHRHRFKFWFHNYWLVTLIRDFPSELPFPLASQKVCFEYYEHDSKDRSYCDPGQIQKSGSKKLGFYPNSAGK